MKFSSFKKIVFLTPVLFIIIYYLQLNRFKAQVLKPKVDGSLKLLADKRESTFDGYFNGAYKPNPNKFIIYTCHRNCNLTSCFHQPYRIWCGGLADRLKGIMSALLWSILTNRTFLINSKFPCPLEQTLLPNVIPWKSGLKQVIKKINEKQLSTVHFEVYAGGPTVYTFQDKKPINTSNFFKHLLKFKKNSDVILFKTNYDMFSNITSEKLYHARLKQLGYNASNFYFKRTFQFFYKLLFKLSPRLESQNQKFLRIAKPNNRTKLVCIQLRHGGVTDTYSDQVRMTLNHTKIIINFVDTKFLSKLHRYKIYLTTDRKEAENEVNDFFGTKNVVLTSGEITHIDRDKLYVSGNLTGNCDVYDKTYIDFHLLQYCDMGVISRGGFGRMGIYNRKYQSNTFYAYIPVTQNGVVKYTFQRLLL